MILKHRLRLAWLVLTRKETNDAADPIGYTSYCIGEAQHVPTKTAKTFFEVAKDIIARCESVPGLTWKDFNMALADIINTATQQIAANTTAFESAAAAAVTAATTSLNEQISTLTATNTTIQGELDAATTAADALTTAVAAQTTAATPPATPATGA